MRAFSIVFVSAAIVAILATAQRAQSTDLSKPSLLVATRDLQDPFFEHAVILMVPSAEPPLLAGLIINNPAKQRVRDIFPANAPIEERRRSDLRGRPG